MAHKAAYVRAEAKREHCPAISPGGFRCDREPGHDGRHRISAGHTCHWPGCKREVPPAMWGCSPHWFKLPVRLRNMVWAAYEPGQEISKTPSANYIAVARQIQDWIASQPADPKTARGGSDAD